MSALITAVVVTGVYSSNKVSGAANNAARAQSESNDAALAQNQAQFEASQRLQQQLASQSIAMQGRIAGQQMATQRQIASQQMATQQSIANQQISEARRQFEAVQQVLSPFITAGNQALGPLQQYQNTGVDALQGQRNLIGLNGQVAQQSAIGALSASPEMAAYLQQGENAILQNAAATGGLRGGNTQAALSEFRPQLLAGLISQQYDRLGGLAGLGANTSSMVYQTGQSAAAGQASAGMQVAGQVGSALAGYSQGVGNAMGNYSSGVSNAMGNYASGASSAMGNLAQGQNSALNAMTGAYNQYYNNQGSIAAGNALAQGQAQAGLANSISGALGSYTMLQAMRGGGLQSNANTAGLYSLSTGAGGAGLRSGGGLGLRGSF